MDGKSPGRQSSLLGLPLLFAGCSLILNDLPEPVDDEAAASAGRGGGTANQGGKSSAGAVGSGNTAGIEPSAGVGAGASTSAGGQGGQNATPGSAGGDAEAGGTSTAEGGSGGGGCPCDCDRDGALSDDIGCHVGGGPADCDDDDPRAKPGQSDFFIEPSLVVDFDYDCDTDTEPQFTATLTCPLLSGMCSSAEGFIGSLPACGDSGSWGGCIPNGLGGCKTDEESNTKKMPCH